MLKHEIRLHFPHSWSAGNPYFLVLRPDSPPNQKLKKSDLRSRRCPISKTGKKEGGKGARSNTTDQKRTKSVELWSDTCGSGSGAKAPPLAARPKRIVLEKMPGQLEASFLIFLTLGLIKQSNTPRGLVSNLPHPRGSIQQSNTHTHQHCSPPPLIAKESSSVGRALAPHRLAPRWLHPDPLFKWSSLRSPLDIILVFVT